ncbi:MAG: hypothetical protein EP315_00035 [Gammaproteobacteria bacterium]|nr:MAG: hypothetical protein EP315_00035 [Gammaproteobacteria bacterium]
MERVFYYSGYRLTVFHWVNGKYVDSYAFNPGEDGFSEFTKYLHGTEKSPVRFLVDVIEEDFKKDKIPHVGSKDQKAILKRIIERQYRSSGDYYRSVITGRDKAGRRDDNVFYSVLTNPQMLEPWLKLIDEADVPVSGIWSLPLLSHELVETLEIKESNVLLVSQQVPSNLRQSFFKNGKFQISRSAVVNLEEIPLGQYITEEVEQTTRFLANQRYIGFDEKLTVHIICDNRDISGIQEYCEDSPLRSFHYYGLRDVQEKMGAGDLKKHYCNGIYASLCKKKWLPLGDYGPASLFAKYYRHIASRALVATSVLLLIISSLLMLSYVSDARIMEQEIELLQEYTQVIENNYVRELQKLEPKLKLATSMKSAVMLADDIRQASNISPQNFMVDVSKVFTYTGMLDTRIIDIEWRSTQNSDFKSLTSRNIEPIFYGTDKAIKHASTIRGYINLGDGRLKQTVEKVEAIIKAFRNNKQVEQVEVVRMPLDVRPEASIENDQGTSVDKSSDISNRGQFEIRVLMKGRDA